MSDPLTSPSSQPPLGRVAAIDYGTRRIGIAISDVAREFCNPLETYERRDAAADAEYFCQLARRETVCQWVVGLPVHMSGEASGKSREARQFGNWLGETTGLPVRFFDERFSSREADDLMTAGGLTEKQRRRRRDMLAAYVILRSYLQHDPEDPANSEGRSPL